MKACEAKAILDGRRVACSLSIGHGGNHAQRVEHSRCTAHDTVVYRTTAVWGRDDQIARAWRPEA